MRDTVRRALPLIALLTPLATHAQTLRGIAVDAGNSPVPGVVVMLLDNASRVVARGTTSSSGEFRLAAVAAGTYRLRTLRIGFKPTISEPYAMAAGAEVSKRVVLTGIPVALDAVRTTGESVCRAFADSAAATFAVWEQVHGALTAADLAANGRTIVATTLAYERTLENLEGHGVPRVLKQTSKVSTGYVARPWRETPVDSLHRAGYVVQEGDALTAYYAPGLEMLLSNRFIEDHCFHLTTDRALPTLIGIAFEPSPERKKIPEIRGTLWVDRGSAELRRLEFKYTNVSQEDEDYGGGRIDFQRAHDGTWLVSRWSIHMPVFDQSKQDKMRFRRSQAVVAIQTTGGELAVARRGSDTLWMRAPFTVAGTIRDSVSNNPISAARIALLGTTVETTAEQNGRFTLRGVLPGEYTAEVQTRSLDSVNTTHRAPLMILDSATAVELRAPSGAQFIASLCGKTARGQGTGVILGSARTAADSSPGGLRVVAEWAVDPKEPSRMQRAEVRGAPDGSYRICGVPLNVSVALTARGDSVSTVDPKLVRLSSAVQLTRADLALYTTSELAKRGATFIGIVVADSSRLPIVGAEITLPDIEKTAFTDSAGAFRIAGVPPGEHRVLVRRIGFGAADTKLAFTGFETVERRIVLGRAVTLEAVMVNARMNEREMPDFEDNRRVGLGKFMTRPELDKYTGMKIGTVLDQLSDVATVHGFGSQLWVASRRQPPAGCPPNKNLPDCLRGHGYYVPDTGEMSRGMPTMCFAQVYIDRMLMNGVGEPTQPFDLTTVVPESVEAIEWYAGPSQTPLKYSRMGSNCGVLVIWTRR